MAAAETIEMLGKGRFAVSRTANSGQLSIHGSSGEAMIGAS
jgi:hypothetical protein